MKNCHSHIRARQKLADGKGDKFERAQKERVKGAVGIIIDRLKIFNEKVRHDQGERRAVHNDAHPSLTDFCAQGIRPLRDAHAGEKRKPLVIQKRLDIAGFQHHIELRILKPLLDLLQDIRIDPV